MNLFEMLDTYKTNPVNEIRKINDILDRRQYVDYEWMRLKDVFGIVFGNSEFASLETTFESFLSNIVFLEYNSTNLFSSINNYRYLCEFLFALIDCGIDYNYYQPFEDDLKQLEILIENGLSRTGYVLVPYNKHRVTKKKDEQAEAVASTNKNYNKNILDYLLAKSLEEKEKALTSLAIQLEASKPKDSYSKQNREYVQLLRHKDENIKTTKYSWFYENDKYEENLDKLFHIYLSIISHDKCFDYIEEFKKNKGDK